MVQEIIEINNPEEEVVENTEDDPFTITFSRPVRMMDGSNSTTIKFREPTMRDLIGSPSLYVIEPPTEDEGAPRTFTNYEAVMAVFFKVSDVMRESIYDLPASDYWEIQNKITPFVDGSVRE